MTRNDALRRLRTIVAGIDRDELEDEGGWWSTSQGVTFGAARLAELEHLVEDLTRPEFCEDA